MTCRKDVVVILHSCLKAPTCERHAPFSMEDRIRTKMIREKLDESLAVAADPNASRYSHEEIFAPLRAKYGYDVQS